MDVSLLFGDVLKGTQQPSPQLSYLASSFAEQAQALWCLIERLESIPEPWLHSIEASAQQSDAKCLLSLGHLIALPDAPCR